MAAIDYLTEKGFSAKVSGKRLVVSPASRLTDDVRKYIKAHRLELIAELAANDGQERRSYWRVQHPTHKPFVMISGPITREEALATIRALWPDAALGDAPSAQQASATTTPQAPGGPLQ